MTTTSALIVITLCMILILVLVYWYSNRVKRELDTPQDHAPLQPPFDLDVPEPAVANLLRLSREPVLIRQTEDGVRVQLDDRPLVPLTILTDKEAAASLRQLAVAVSQTCGPRWSALVTVKSEGKAVVQRLS